jgi:hypothetical protein
MSEVISTPTCEEIPARVTPANKAVEGENNENDLLAPEHVID